MCNGDVGTDLLHMSTEGGRQDGYAAYGRAGRHVATAAPNVRNQSSGIIGGWATASSDPSMDPRGRTGRKCWCGLASDSVASDVHH